MDKRHNNSVQNLLKKINYIEAEVEIQKQILFSIPSDNQEEIQKVIEKIAQAKNDINELRAQIESISPDEYQKIVKIEESAATLKKLATEKNFTTVENMSTLEHCSLKLQDGKELSCLVKACDEDGNWTVITVDGDLLHFDKNSIKL